MTPTNIEKASLDLFGNGPEEYMVLTFYKNDTFINSLCVAKNAQVLGMKVFSDKSEGAMTDDIVKAIEDSVKLGADIITKENTAIIKGVSKLYGAELNVYDLRGGAGAVLAGLVSEGYTTISDIYHIDRGYYEMEKDLQKLGAEIERITTKE